jgi:hypothetical protein
LRSGVFPAISRSIGESSSRADGNGAGTVAASPDSGVAGTVGGTDGGWLAVGAVGASGVVRGGVPIWPGTGVVEPGADGGGVGPGTDGDGIPAGLEGGAVPGAVRRGALGDEGGGEVTEGGDPALPGVAPGICCARPSNGSASRQPSKSMPPPKKRSILPERLWDTASSSQLPDHSHAMLACLAFGSMV